MPSRAAALLATFALACSGCVRPPQLLLGEPSASAAVIAYDLDRWAGERPSETELARSISAPVDPIEFYALLAHSEPRSGSVLWLGGYLVAVRDGPREPDLYRISYYGSFFKRVGVPGWYEVRAAQRARWDRLLGQPGALGSIIEQRIVRNAGTVPQGSP